MVVYFRECSTRVIPRKEYLDIPMVKFTRDISRITSLMEKGNGSRRREFL